MLSRLLDLVRRAGEIQPDPPKEVIIATAMIAVVAVAYGPTWRLTRNFITLAHEAGHALAAVLSGRRLSGIRLHSDTSGLTVSRGKPTGFGMIITGLAGYVTPPLLGLGAAALLAGGRATLLLLVCMALLPAVLIMIRNLFGILSVALTLAIIAGVAAYAPPAVQGAFGFLLTWFLLVGGLRAIIELQGSRRRGTAAQSDADQVARLTRVPALIWVGFFVVVALSCLVISCRWLLGAPDVTWLN